MIFLYLRGLFPTITFYGRSKALKIRKMNILLHIAQKQHKKAEYSKSLFVPFVTCPVVPFCHVPQGILGVLTLYAGNS